MNTPSEFNSFKVLTKNAAVCAKCGDEIESTDRHEFVSCKCGAIFVDGGTAYLRRGGASLDDIIDRSEYRYMNLQEVEKQIAYYRECIPVGEQPNEYMSGTKNYYETKLRDAERYRDYILNL